MHAHLFFDAGESDVWMLLPMAFAVRHGRRPEFIDFDTDSDDEEPLPMLQSVCEHRVKR